MQVTKDICAGRSPYTQTFLGWVSLCHVGPVNSAVALATAANRSFGRTLSRQVILKQVYQVGGGILTGITRQRPLPTAPAGGSDDDGNDGPPPAAAVGELALVQSELFQHFVSSNSFVTLRHGAEETSEHIYHILSYQAAIRKVVTHKSPSKTQPAGRVTAHTLAIRLPTVCNVSTRNSGIPKPRAPNTVCAPSCKI
jgi:hypothetical protein